MVNPIVNNMARLRREITELMKTTNEQERTILELRAEVSSLKVINSELLKKQADKGKTNG